MKMKKEIVSFAAAVAAAVALGATPSEIAIDLKMDEINYVVGERIRCVVDVKNMSPEKVSVGYSNSRDRLFVELYRASDHSQLERVSKRQFSAPFRVEANEGQKLEVFLSDHYGLAEEIKYLARPVLVHKGMRYEGTYRAFDVVHGMKVSSAVQMFANKDGLSREFELRRWARNGTMHLFLAAQDHGTSERVWQTTDIGPTMRITQPTISILQNGVVIVFHRNGADSLVRSEFWSLPDALHFNNRRMVLDPEMAGQRRVQQIYDESGGVKPVDRPWWKFW